LLIASNCGHVVNIDRADFFNQQSILFIQEVINKNAYANEQLISR